MATCSAAMVKGGNEMASCRGLNGPKQCLQRFLGISGRDPSVSQVQPVTCGHLVDFSLLIRGIFYRFF